MVKLGKLLVFLFLFLYACSSMEMKGDIKIPQIDFPKKEEVVTKESPADFRIATEDITPLKLKRVSVNARQTPLRDILLVLCRDAGLNLIIEKDVDPNVPVTLVLSNVTLKDALDAVFSSTDYFYKIERNMLIVKDTDTKIFHLSAIPIQQNYATDVGGDILGGVTGQLTGGTTSGTTSTTSGTTILKGNVSKSEKADDAAYKFWDSIEKALSTLLSISPSQTVTTAGQPGQAAVKSSRESYLINRMTGTIMVTATKKNMQKVEEYLQTVKKVMSRQVLIEAKVIEVALSKSLKYGIDWSFLREWSHGTHNWSIGGATSGFTRVIPSDSPYSELKFSLTTTAIKDFSFIIKALGQFGDVRTLSNPRVSIMNGQTSLFTVGRNYSFISKVESNVTTSGTGSPIITYTVDTGNLLSGLIIGIVPYIDDKGEISLTITPIVSNLIEMREVSFGSQEATTKIQLPSVDLRELSTTVKVKDGDVVVIGGMIKKEESLSENKMPLLGDIPLLGELFKSKDKEDKNTELVILLQPRIITQ
ncbi:MSHA biogenesis protein MshL [Thermodesulfovibrio aggregans]|uniref:MSHA biogenesis protein MshL n=1 Tax=Thermodesulfovibrio aggregans TaxID=86166 RepID=A0A0U9IAK6_9BACT|nr:pilus (MSHA type) biogenesis protein MshL [Thermodesulfovibrio aggregans]GAQ95302.1 MSHA biogenesis protein MshL [Thermodesulfovibrio aggregans]